ncbi:hypothetical protein S40288_09994 [Stachybotrys chartarum IBT 40288]|nr:hypothetical protein S40288_09994 [Stachybotrys chartarum IBT 40288]
MLPKSASWRRRPADGAVDDRWSSLQLFEDEETGQIFVYESRREWLPSNSQSQRNCYRKELLFPPPPSDEEVAYGTDDDPTNWDSDNLVTWNSEYRFETPVPENVHAGDDGSLGTTVAYNNSLIRTYNPSCRCFVDVINDPLAVNPASQRLLLRMRPRPLDGPIRASHAVEAVSPTRSPELGIPDLAGHDGINTWPPKEYQDESGSLFSSIQHVMNPQQPAETMDWAADERFLIYSPKATLPSQLRAIVLVSFDPTLHLQAVPNLYGCQPCEGCIGVPSYPAACSHGQVQEVADSLPRPSQVLHHSEKPDLSRAVIGRGSSGPDQAAEIEQSTWATTSRAFYLTIGGLDERPRGFDMTHPRRSC